MNHNEYGWKGIQVKHTDGRTGTIIYEGANFGGIAVQIKANDGSEAWIGLSATFGDKGDSGWSWLCKDFNGANGKEDRWLELGNWQAMEARNRRNAEAGNEV